MIRGLYSAAGGMQATAQQQDVTAQNLTHANKPGYRREVLRFETSGQRDDIQGPATSLHTDFTPGHAEFTGNKLDVALNGPGFFTVQGPNGALYTRNGVFQITGQGHLVTNEGLAVLGTAGPIALPPAATNIEIREDGSVVADGSEADQLRIAGFPDPTALQRVGTTFFVPPPGVIATQVEPDVRQGYREASNTTVVHELVQMMAGLRQFEATQRALRSIGDSVGLTTRPLNR
ncbi:MAG: flagellar hook basal-body protein [Planctomycetales bacterium]|nr:flagellar hook basal-body protein [Planctomycetales bacterium]